VISDCTAVVMAGGESRRMGSDKATVVLGEATLLQRVVGVVRPLFPQLLISVRAPRPDLDLPQVCDDPAHAGPLAGLLAAFERANTPWIFAVATDMPFVQPALIEALALRRAGHQAVVPMVDGHPQPLAAFYAASCAGPIRQILNRPGKHSVRAMLEELQVFFVDAADLRAADPGLVSFFDLDTPQDLAAAKKIEDRWLDESGQH
jgi:molybdopterin-guanine dinucleotide biosynthesis protein A